MTDAEHRDMTEGPVTLYLANPLSKWWQFLWRTDTLYLATDKWIVLRASGRISALAAGALAGAHYREIAALGALVPGVAFLPCLGASLCNRPMIGRFSPWQMVEAIAYCSLGLVARSRWLGRTPRRQIP